MLRWRRRREGEPPEEVFDFEVEWPEPAEEPDSPSHPKRMPLDDEGDSVWWLD
jgi:hypothetical protein